MSCVAMVVADPVEWRRQLGSGSQVESVSSRLSGQEINRGPGLVPGPSIVSNILAHDLWVSTPEAEVQVFSYHEVTFEPRDLI